MTKTRRIRFDRLIAAAVAGILLFTVLVFGMYRLIDLLFSGNYPDIFGKKDKDVIVNPEPVKTNQNIRLQLLDYAVYKDDSDELGFSFIIARMEFSDDEPVSFDLSNLQTSEKIHLNDVAAYLNKLKDKSYDIDKLGIMTSVSGKEDRAVAGIFIPFTTESSSLRVLNSLDASMIEFDLTENVNDMSCLKFETDDQIDADSCGISISSAFISDVMLHNGEGYKVPSTMSIYTFSICLDSSEKDMVITDACFVRDRTNEVIKCMGSDYASAEIGNALDEDLQLGENGALFFEVNENGGPDFAGCLMIKLNGNSDWIKIRTDKE